MNYSGDDIISRGTKSSGRGLIALGIAVVLIKKLGLDVSQTKLLGIEITATQLDSGAWIILSFLMAMHFVNWLADAIGLGSWNSAMKDKGVETHWNGGGKAKGRIEFVLSVLKDIDPQKDEQLKEDLRHVMKELAAMKRSKWWFDRFALFYVVVFHFFLPILVSSCAIWLVTHA